MTGIMDDATPRIALDEQQPLPRARPGEEHVLLLDERGRLAGTAAKAGVHGTDTPLHLAFSCYAFDHEGRFLLTRRAFSKPTWPGVWTNSCCGHPALGESLPDAVARRLQDELGVQVERLDLVLPRFRYRAVMDNGVTENELCPVYLAVVGGEPAPDPDEVADVVRVDWADFTAAVRSGRREVSPWCELQLAELERLGSGPARWAAADPALLPPAAGGAGAPLPA